MKMIRVEKKRADIGHTRRVKNKEKKKPWLKLNISN